MQNCSTKTCEAMLPMSSEMSCMPICFWTPTMYLQSFERSINRRHVHTKQTALSIAGMYTQSRQHQTRYFLMIMLTPTTMRAPSVFCVFCLAR